MLLPSWEVYDKVLLHRHALVRIATGHIQPPVPSVIKQGRSISYSSNVYPRTLTGTVYRLSSKGSLQSLKLLTPCALGFQVLRGAMEQKVKRAAGWPGQDTAPPTSAHVRNRRQFLSMT